MIKTFNIKEFNNTDKNFLNLNQKLDDFFSIQRTLYNENKSYTDTITFTPVGKIIGYNLNPYKIVVELKDEYIDINPDKYYAGFLMSVNNIKDNDYEIKRIKDIFLVSNKL